MRMPRGHRWGIAQALAGLILVALLPFVALELFRGAEDVGRRREAVVAQALAQASEEAETMDDYLRFTERFLATLADTPAVRSLNAAEAEALLHAVRNHNPNYVNVFLLDAQGRQIASTVPAVSDPSAAERPYFQQALETGRIALSPVLTEYGRAVVVLAYPVMADGHTPVGVVAVALNIARLSSVIGFVGLPRGSVVLLVQRDGTVIAADEPEAWVGRSLAGSSLLATAQSRTKGTATAVLPDGVRRVVGFQALTRAPWLLVAAIPQSEVDAEARRSLVRAGQQFALVALATALLAWAVLRRIVLPIRVVVDGARAFAAGYLNRRIPLRRRDELGDLVEALNTMASTLQRQMEEQAAHAAALQELHRLQTEFVATASHELRTPVTAIRSYAEALLRPDITDPALRQECLQGIDRSSARLAALVRTLLDVSRIDSGRIPVTPRAVDAEAATRAAIAQAAPQSPERVRLAVMPDVPPVRADPERLEDILANLIANACAYSPPDAPVEVRIARDGTAAVAIAVQDQGVGIPEAEQERIFERFYQVQRGPERRSGGSGLGLYIARAYAEAMGGRIHVRSRPGQGSTFTVTLPAADAAEVANDGEGGTDRAGITGIAPRG
jgi:signal transduction histidine kinase